MEPDFTLSSTEYAVEYKKDREAAKAKYQGKVIELSGRIVGFGAGDATTHYLELFGRDSFDSVSCIMKMKNPWLKATPGQTVKLRGVLPSDPFSLNLYNCHIIEATGDPCPKLTADQLAKAYDSDAKKARAYQYAQAVILEGVIAKKETEDNGLVTVELKHAGKCKVVCVFSAGEKEQTKALAVGQKIRAIGKPYDCDEKKFSMFTCVLIEE